MATFDIRQHLPFFRSAPNEPWKISVKSGSCAIRWTRRRRALDGDLARFNAGLSLTSPEGWQLVQGRAAQSSAWPHWACKDERAASLCKIDGPRCYMTPETIVRLASRGDLPELVSIYNHYVTNSHATFDAEPVTVESRAGWFDRFADIGPHRLLVAAEGDRVLGCASSAPYREHPAFACTVEVGIYLHPELRSRGIGSAGRGRSGRDGGARSSK